jgi:hypothetical protein
MLGRFNLPVSNISRCADNDLNTNNSISQNQTLELINNKTNIK